MKKKNTLLIKGYFEEGCKKNNSLKIMLDQKELNVAIDEEINQGIALSSELGTSRAKYIYELQVELLSIDISLFLHNNVFLNMPSFHLDIMDLVLNLI